MPDIWDTMKRPNPKIMSIYKGEEMQTKIVDKIFNIILAENFPKLETKRIIQEAYRTSNHQNQKKPTSRHIINKTLNMQNKEKILKGEKEKNKSHVKANPLE
jgi:hypothetical protein